MVRTVVAFARTLSKRRRCAKLKGIPRFGRCLSEVRYAFRNFEELGSNTVGLTRWSISAQACMSTMLEAHCSNLVRRRFVQVLRTVLETYVRGILRVLSQVWLRWNPTDGINS
jgi:hypothetical protein